MGRVVSGRVEICEHSPAWRAEFQSVGQRLRGALGGAALRIDHIGSTAIVGLAAKPIIDIQISVRRLEPMRLYRAPLESLGYVWRQSNPERTKRYFREPPSAKRTHIHVRQAGSWHERFALLFRDYVREHEDARQRYEDTKRELAETYRCERERYTEAKSDVLWAIMRHADRWAAYSGWEPGPSDA